jgi:hypothetical protein
VTPDVTRRELLAGIVSAVVVPPVAQTPEKLKASEYAVQMISRFEGSPVSPKLIETQAEVFVHHFVTCPLTQNQFDALVSFTFNTGPGGLEKLLDGSQLNLGYYDAVSPRMMEFIRARNKRNRLVVLPGLVKRRREEAELFEE